MTRKLLRRIALCIAVAAITAVSGCDWRGANSLPLPGTEGSGPHSYEVKAELPDITNIERNTRVRVHDVTVGNVTKIERQGWHALVTMRLDGDVKLPANATATVGQTSLLGTLHIELAAPRDVPPEGKLHNGSLIPLSSGRAYPTTEQTLAALSMFLNGGGLGHVQDITKALSTAFAGRERDLRSFIEQLAQFIGHLNDQKQDIVGATESLNNLIGQFAAQKPVLDKALNTVPDALNVVSDRRQDLTEALDQLGKLAAVTYDSVDHTKAALVSELHDLGPVLQSLGDAGPALTGSLGELLTFPWPVEDVTKWVRGDYGNVQLIFDLTLSRLDASLFTGSRWEGNLTELELQWGRTIGQQPSPYTAANPLIVPYHLDQGP